MKKLITLILAAGKGTRMKSDLPKVLHKINGRELVKYVVDQAKKTGSDDIIVITGHKSSMVRESLKDHAVRFAEQKEQLGTGHAVMQAEGILSGSKGDILILCGDVPLLKPETLSEMRDFHNSSNAAATVLTTEFEDPFGYGRIIKDSKGYIVKIVEQKDADENEKAVKEINSGVYIIDKDELFNSLKHISSDNASREYYLTDVIGILKEQNKKISTFMIEDNNEILGINTPEQLNKAESIIKDRTN